MKSPHLQYIDQLIARTQSQLDADCLRLRRASCLAKLGHAVQAREQVDQVRGDYIDHPNSRISAWAHLAESHISFYTGTGADAVDRAKRAYALSSAMRHRDVQAVSAAWLAHYAFGQQAFDTLAANVRDALDVSGGALHEASSRASLVVGLSLHFAARPDLAQKWYVAARSHAIAEHDEMTTSAIMYNMTAMRVANLRMLELDGSGIVEQPELLLVGASSTESYDAAIGSVGQDSFTPLLRAQVLANQGRWEESACIYRQQLDASRRQGLQRLHCWYLSDLAWCEINLGNSELARQLINEAISSIDPATHADDAAATHARAAQVFQQLGEGSAASSFTNSAKEQFLTFRAARERLLDLLAGLVPVNAPPRPSR